MLVYAVLLAILAGLVTSSKNKSSQNTNLSFLSTANYQSCCLLSDYDRRLKFLRDPFELNSFTVETEFGLDCSPCLNQKGFNFNLTSFISLNFMPQEKFSFGIWIYISSPGTLCEFIPKPIGLIVESTGLQILEEKLYSNIMNKWSFLHLSFESGIELNLDSKKFYIFYENEGKFYRVGLGDYSNSSSGFTGIIYGVYIRELPGKENFEFIIEACRTILEVEESLDEKKYSEFCLDDESTFEINKQSHSFYICSTERCYSICPTLHKFHNDECLEGSGIEINFNMVTFKQEISDDKDLNSFKLIKALYSNQENTLPTIGNNRGLYFNRNFLISNEKILLSNHCVFSFWLNNDNPGTFLEYSNFEIEINYKDHVLITYSYQGNKKSSVSNLKIKSKQWTFLALSLHTLKNLSFLALLHNQNSIDYFQESATLYRQLSLLKIGSSSIESEFKAWIFEFSFANTHKELNSFIKNIGYNGECFYPLTHNRCLETCEPHSYFSFRECRSCSENLSCKDRFQYFCHDSNCNTCSNFLQCEECAIDDCSQECFKSCKYCSGATPYQCTEFGENFFEYKSFCLTNCPTGTTKVDSFCDLEVNFQLNFNLHTMKNRVSDSSSHITFSAYPNKFESGYGRGWFISTITHREPFFFSPFPSLSMWIKTDQEGSILSKTNGIENEISIDIKVSSNLLIKFKGTLQDYEFLIPTYSSILNKWLLLSLSLINLSENLQIVTNLNGNLISTQIIEFEYLTSLPDTFLIIGDQTHKSWIFKFTYLHEYSKFSLIYLDSEKCIHPVSFHECLWDCPITDYFDGSSCASCNSNCEACRRVEYCSQCNDPNCLECEDFLTDSCLKFHEQSLLEQRICVIHSKKFRNLTQTDCSARCSVCGSSYNMCTSCSEGYVKSIEGICVLYCPHGKQ